MSFVTNIMRTAVLALGAVIFANNANALPVTWSLSAIYDDGVTASGSYVFDADTTTFSSIAITTSLSETLTFDNPVTSSTAVLQIFGADAAGAIGTPVYTFNLEEGMTNAGGVINILASVLLGGTGVSFGGTCAGDPACQAVSVTRNLVSGTVTTVAAVPLPAGGVLLLTALCGFGAIRRFGNMA